MSEAAKAARSAMKDKIKRLLMPYKGKVDASDYGPEEVLNADIKTGMRPVSRRAYKSGGKVEGECGPVRADRKPRKSGGKAITPNSMINRNAKDANEEREGKKHVGALARGGVPKGHYDDDKPNLRLVKTHTGPEGHTAKVYKDRDWGEYRTKFFKPDGTYQPKADSHADDADDAHSTAMSAVKKGFKSGGATKFEGSARDEREDSKLAKKHGMSKAAWERSAMDDKHDSQRSMKGLKSGGMPHKGGGGMLDDDMPEREPMRASRMRDDDGPRYNRGAVDNMIKSSRQKIVGREAKMIHALLKGRQGGDYARGGAPKPTTVSDGEYEGTRPTGGRLARADGGSNLQNAATFLSPAYAISQGKMPGVLGLLGKKDGGRLARAHGGKTGKGKMNVNIIISTGPRGQGPQPGMPDGPLGSTPGRLIAAPAPPSAPPPAMPPPPMPPGGPPGAMGGAPMGGMPPMPRKSGGRTGHGVYRTYKDMDAGSGGGLGRLEKIEIQKHKD